MKRVLRRRGDPGRAGDGGFSLVELIIVIAVMAVLIGVVGTQVIPYLERSRQGKDFQVFSAWNSAGMAAYGIVADAVDAEEEYVILITNGTVTCTNASLDGADKLVENFCDLTGLTASGSNMISSKMASKAGKNILSVMIVMPPMEDGIAPIGTYMCTDAGGSTVSTDFSAIENR